MAKEKLSVHLASTGKEKNNPLIFFPFLLLKYIKGQFDLHTHQNRHFGQRAGFLDDPYLASPERSILYQTSPPAPEALRSARQFSIEPGPAPQPFSPWTEGQDLQVPAFTLPSRPCLPLQVVSMRRTCDTHSRAHGSQAAGPELESRALVPTSQPPWALHSPGPTCTYLHG